MNYLLFFFLTTILYGCSTELMPKTTPKTTPMNRFLKASENLDEAPNDIEVRSEMSDAIENLKTHGLNSIQYKIEHEQDYESALDEVVGMLEKQPNDIRLSQLKRMIEMRLFFKSELERAKNIWPSKPHDALQIVNSVLLEQPGYKSAQDTREIWMREAHEKTLQPELSERVDRIATLNFRSQPIGDIFNAIAKITGLEFIFDQGVNSTQQASIITNETRVIDALNLLLRTNQLDKKVLNKTTLLIYPMAKSREYEDLQVRVFYLTQANPNSVQNVIRQVTLAKNIQIDERANAIVIRDTPDVIAVAERLVYALDIVQSEVTLDVQVLEVNSNEALEFGVDYPKSIGFFSEDKITFADLLNLDKESVNVKQLSATIKMLQQNGKTKILANPKIRVRNMEPAEIKIGEQIPLVTTTVSNGVTSENVQYQDVGLTLSVEPRISVNNEVAIKVKLVSSSVLNKQPTANGSDVYTLTNRSAETTLTARDGDTQILAGLINEEQKNSNNGLPYISNVSWLDRIFGVKAKESKSTELILLITPQIERTLELPASYNSHFFSGSEEKATTLPLYLRE